MRLVPTGFTFSQVIRKLSAHSFTLYKRFGLNIPVFSSTATCREKYLKRRPHHEAFGIIVGNLRGKPGRKSRDIGRGDVLSSHHHRGRTLLYSLGHAPRCHWLG